PAHVEVIFRRAAATSLTAGKVLIPLVWFKGCIGIEGVHPLEGGFVRLKFRRDRRHGLPIEPALRFYPKYLVETVCKQFQWTSLYLRMRRIYLKIKHDPRRQEYTDLAMSPVEDDETEGRELFQSDAAQAYVRQERRLDKLRHGEAA